MRSAKGRERSAKSLSPRCGRVLAQRLVASAAALQEGRGLVRAAERHGRRGHKAGQQRDVVVVAEDLREAARRFGSRVKLRRPARCKQLHLPPMMLHALAPFVEIVVATFGEANLKRLPRRAVAAPKPLQVNRKSFQIGFAKGRDDNLQRNGGRACGNQRRCNCLHRAGRRSSTREPKRRAASRKYLGDDTISRC